MTTNRRPLEVAPVEPFVADQIHIRRCKNGSFVLEFSFDDGDGPRLTAKGIIAAEAMPDVRKDAAAHLDDLGVILATEARH